MRLNFDVQRHPVHTFRAVDDKTAAHDFRMAFEDRIDLRWMDELPLTLLIAGYQLYATGDLCGC